jgi:hypothetical protein
MMMMMLLFLPFVDIALAVLLKDVLLVGEFP